MCTPIASDGAVAGLNVQLSLVQEQLKQLMNQRTTSIEGSRCPSPRRVRFVDECDRPNQSRDHDRSRRDDGRDDRSDRRFSRTCNDRPASLDYSCLSQQHLPNVLGFWLLSPDSQHCLRLSDRRKQFWRDQSGYERCLDGGSQGRSDRGRDRLLGENNQNPSTCGKCGWDRHEYRNDCPAVDQECYGCGKYGHFKRVCHFTTVTGAASQE